MKGLQVGYVVLALLTGLGAGTAVGSGRGRVELWMGKALRTEKLDLAEQCRVRGNGRRFERASRPMPRGRTWENSMNEGAWALPSQAEGAR